MEKHVKLAKSMSEPEYRQVDAISYSNLSALDRSPYNLINNDFKESEAIIYGAAVDTLLFDGKEVFESKFTAMFEEKPSWMLGKVLDTLLDEIMVNHDEDLDKPLSSNLEDYSDVILRVAKAVEYGKGWHDATIIKKVLEGCSEVFKIKIENRHKKPLSPQQYEYVINSVRTLESHDFTKYLFEEKEGIDIYKQYAILWEHESTKCKSLLDLLIVDHNTKQIYPVDLKTTGKHVLSFPQSFIEWKYYLQASYYTDAVKYLVENTPELKDYKINLFQFVVISSNDPLKPLIYKTTENDYIVGKYGGEMLNYDRTIKGYIQLLNERKWHIDNNLYEFPKEVYDSNGQLTLNLFKNG